MKTSRLLQALIAQEKLNSVELDCSLNNNSISLILIKFVLLHLDPSNRWDFAKVNMRVCFHKKNESFWCLSLDLYINTGRKRLSDPPSKRVVLAASYAPWDRLIKRRTFASTTFLSMLMLRSFYPKSTQQAIDVVFVMNRISMHLESFAWKRSLTGGLEHCGVRIGFSLFGNLYIYTFYDLDFILFLNDVTVCILLDL